MRAIARPTSPGSATARQPVASTAEAATVAAPFGVVRVGGRSLRRSQIVGVTISERCDRDIEGPMVNFSSYALIAALFVFAVLDLGWMSRYLLAAVFFGAISLMALSDVFAANRIPYWLIEVRLHDGEVLALAVHTPDERDRLAALVAPVGCVLPSTRL